MNRKHFKVIFFILSPHVLLLLFVLCDHSSKQVVRRNVGDKNTLITCWPILKELMCKSIFTEILKVTFIQSKKRKKIACGQRNNMLSEFKIHYHQLRLFKHHQGKPSLSVFLTEADINESKEHTHQNSKAQTTIELTNLTHLFPAIISIGLIKGITLPAKPCIAISRQEEGGMNQPECPGRRLSISKRQTSLARAGIQLLENNWRSQMRYSLSLSESLSQLLIPMAFRVCGNLRN